MLYVAGFFLSRSFTANTGLQTVRAILLQLTNAITFSLVNYRDFSYLIRLYSDFIRTLFGDFTDVYVCLLCQQRRPT